MKPKYLKSAAEFRKWLQKNHHTEQELLVGFYKVGSGKKGITYQEALDEALCFGWIDGKRQGIDEERWTIRFVRRKRTSVWSLVNVKRAGEMIAAGRMTEAGLAAFEARDPSKSKNYSYEQKAAVFDPAMEKRLKSNRAARTFFESQAPSWRRAATYWVISAKKEETRAKRFEMLIEHLERGKKPKPLIPPGKK